MTRERTFQSTLLLFGCTVAYSMLAFVFLLVLDPAKLNTFFRDHISQSIPGVVYAFTCLAVLYSLWIVATFSYRRPVILTLEIASVFFLLVTSVPLFALAYAVLGLDGSDAGVVTSQDAFIFSVLTFVGTGHPSLEPTVSTLGLYTLESFLGYFLLPLLVALALAVVDRRPFSPLE